MYSPAAGRDVQLVSPGGTDGTQEGSVSKSVLTVEVAPPSLPPIKSSCPLCGERVRNRLDGSPMLYGRPVPVCWPCWEAAKAAQAMTIEDNAAIVAKLAEREAAVGTIAEKPKSRRPAGSYSPRGVAYRVKDGQPL